MSQQARRRTVQGERTRSGILKVAVDVASEEGLEGLTIGRLAEALEMSKSGLYAHFGSKEELQLAAIETAHEIFTQTVILPALQSPEGLERVWGLCEYRLLSMQKRVFRGGCFFVATATEFDGRPGAVRARLEELWRGWMGRLQASIQVAQQQGQLVAEADPALLAFQLVALAAGANIVNELLGEPQTLEHARAAIRTTLLQWATPEGKRLLLHDHA